MTHEAIDRPVTDTPRMADTDPPGVGSEAALFSDDLKPGAGLLDGHYTITGFLNAGGFGITYLAKDTLDRTVLVKECFLAAVCHRVGTTVAPRSRKHVAEFRSLVQGFVEEARSLAKVVHPNIVGVHQVFEENGTAYMVIDHIDGRDLQAILESTDRAFAPTEVVALMTQMLSAVGFIHQLGILHRDISPDNILIDRSGRPILIDFGAAGIAPTADSRTLTARKVVKDGYSPQELYLTGAEQTAASDLYALGATFYHLISGKPPPSSQRRLAALAEGEADPCPPLAGRYPGYPPGFLAAIDAALRVLPNDRLQSAGDWAEVLQQGKAPLPATGPAAIPDIGAKSVGRSPSSTLIRVGALALVAGLAAVWLVLGR